MALAVKKLDKQQNSIAIRGKYAFPVINNKTELFVQVEEAVDPQEIVTYSWEELDSAPRIKMEAGLETEYTLFILPWKGRSVLEPLVPVASLKYTIIEKVMIPQETATPVTLAGYIGRKIKKRREDLSLQQIDIVRKVKESNPESTFSASSISRIEKGDFNYNLFTLEDLCDALDFHISEVFPPKN